MSIETQWSMDHASISKCCTSYDTTIYLFSLSFRCSPEGITRLETLKTISDGFDIAAIDMQLRGPGQILGVHQKVSAAVCTVVLFVKFKHYHTIFMHFLLLNLFY